MKLNFLCPISPLAFQFRSFSLLLKKPQSHTLVIFTRNIRHLLYSLSTSDTCYIQFFNNRYLLHLLSLAQTLVTFTFSTSDNCYVNFFHHRSLVIFICTNSDSETCYVTVLNLKHMLYSPYQLHTIVTLPPYLGPNCYNHFVSPKPFIIPLSNHMHLLHSLFHNKTVATFTFFTIRQLLHSLG